MFKITPAGSLTTLHQFNIFEGLYPGAALVQGSDGNFYGTVGYGTVFKITPAGSLTLLYDGGADFELTQGSDGYFYGTTYEGGTNHVSSPYGDGTVFRLFVALNPPANQIAGIELFGVFGDTYTALSIPSVAGETYQLQYTDSMNPTNWINSGDPTTSIGGPLTTFDLVEPMTPQRFYRFTITP